MEDHYAADHGRCLPTQQHILATELSMKLRLQDWILIWGGVIATAIWGNSWRDWLTLAVVILLYLIVRTLWPKQTSLKPKEEDNSFLITSSNENDTLEQEELELDVDLSYCRSPNHFRIHRQFDIYVSDWEYECRVSSTGVSARLLQFRSRGPGEPEEWRVRDGVVQEADMRAAWAKTKYTWDDVEGKIANLKLETEWSVIPPLYWNGASYFIMAKKVPQPDSRRYFRQELERLRRGIDLGTNELAKLNYKQTEDGKYVPLVEPEVKASDEQWTQFRETIPKFGITTSEFSNGKVLVTLLNKLLAD
jgi:hypothetical protein